MQRNLPHSRKFFKRIFFLKDNELDLSLKSRTVMTGKIDMLLGGYWYNWTRGLVSLVDYSMFHVLQEKTT